MDEDAAHFNAEAVELDTRPFRRWRRRKLPEGMEVHRIPSLITPPRPRPEASFLGLTDRLRLRFILVDARRRMDVFVLMGEGGVTWRDRLRTRVAEALKTKGLRRRYMGDLARRQLPEGAEDQAFNRIF